MNARAVVTGATGLLGTAVLGEIDRNFDCVPVSRRRPDHPNGRAVDLEDSGSAAALVSEARPDVIFHFAALADVDACERFPDRALSANVGMTRNLAEAAAAAPNPPYFVYVSTDHVYDAAGSNRESDVRPRNVYAQTKLDGEGVLGVLPAAASIRTNFFCLGNADREGFAGWLIRNLVEGLPQTVFSDVWFSPIHAGAIPEILFRLWKRRLSGVFNLGSSGPAVSKAAFATRLAAALDLSAANLTVGSVADVGAAAYRPRGMAMDVTAIEDALGVELPTVEQGIAGLAAEWRARNAAAHTRA
jgi:dTDP-4-dehydrorhamnose reductase